MSAERKLILFQQALIQGAKRVAGYYLEASIVEQTAPEWAKFPEYKRPMAIKNRWEAIEAGFLTKASKLGVLDEVKASLAQKDGFILIAETNDPSKIPTFQPMRPLFRPNPSDLTQTWQEALNKIPEIAHDQPLTQIRFSSA